VSTSPQREVEGRGSTKWRELTGTPSDRLPKFGERR